MRQSRRARCAQGPATLKESSIFAAKADPVKGKRRAGKT